MLSNFESAQIIGEYLRNQTELFTTEDFCKAVKSKGVKISKAEATDILRSSDIVFPLVNNEFITRSGVFLGRWFSFKPTKEEVDKGFFMLGHRCMPFVNPEISPDNIDVVINGRLLPTYATEFTLNLAFDVFALFGEGYVIPYVFNDKSNTKVPLASVQYNLPQDITLTAWAFDDIPGGKDFAYGDRILCRVTNWNESIIEMSVQKNEANGMCVSKAAIEREQWYSDFENGLLDSFDKNGPGSSIEEQLSLLFLENQETLCIKNCGSCEEFLKHTKKIGFSPFGVETRIWRTGEPVPYIGEWNKIHQKEMILSDMAMTFSPQVIDAYLENGIYEEKNGKKPESVEEICKKIFPSSLKMSGEERRLILLNIEKRNDILKANYNQFSDIKIAQIRKRILNIFSDVSLLLCDIGNSGVDAIDFPQQELVVLSQLFGHIARLLEEVENVVLREQFPINDVALSLDGMEDTFEGIYGTLKNSLEANRRKGFGIVEMDKN